MRQHLCLSKPNLTPSELISQPSVSTARKANRLGKGVAAPPAGVVYLSTAVITVKSTVGEIAASEALGAVRFRSARE